MKIVLLRHGRTNLPPWPWITARELGQWIAAYNAAGIRDMSPPGSALAVAEQCGLIVTSDLPRSMESGKLLEQGMSMISDGLFREADLPYGWTTFIRMPPYIWAVLFRFLWPFGFNSSGESIHAFRNRTRTAAMRLISLAHEHGSVLFVGHGLINRCIARELLSAGWNGPRKTKIRHWGFTEYSHED